jgi:hypothetical protein
MLPSHCKSDTHSAVAKAARGSPGTGTAIQPWLYELGGFSCREARLVYLVSIIIRRQARGQSTNETSPVYTTGTMYLDSWRRERRGTTSLEKWSA